MTPIFAVYKKVPLVLQIVIGLIIGIILAVYCPEPFSFVKGFGELFVKALKSVAPLLVLVLVTSAIAAHQKGSRNQLWKLIIIYFVSTFLAAVTAVATSFIFPTTVNLKTAGPESAAAVSSIADVLSNILVSAVDNPVNALINANYISILVWASALGFMFRNAADTTKRVLEDLASVVTNIVRIVICLAPLGVMGLVYDSIVSQGGIEGLAKYLLVIEVLVAVMAISALIINPFLVFLITRRNPFPLVFNCLVNSAYYAFFTRSSAANIPVNMQLCDKMNVPRSMSSISIPLGATVNMAGAAITVSVLTLTAVASLNGGTLPLDIWTAILLCFMASICACGAGGIAGGSLMLIPLACSLFGIGNDIAMQMVGIGMVIGVVQDSCETALNSSSDALFTIALSKRQQMKEEARIQAVKAASEINS
ncbi:serine/threonine transporter SstT [Succinimonas amylolytica]|uniref:serine/threonine transporter SstT n=1 Tax=Succinimonas amylolytica TaxID=83769 RepID=UPI0023A8FDC9